MHFHIRFHVHDDLNGDVYFCNMVQFLAIKEDNQWEVTKYKPENFKFQVTENEIIFSGNGIFANLILQKTVHGHQLLEARSKLEVLRQSLALDERKSLVQLVYSRITWGEGIMIAANCDKF